MRKLSIQEILRGRYGQCDLRKLKNDQININAGGKEG